MRRQTMIAAGVALAVFVVGFVFVVRPVGAKISDTQKQVEAAQNEQQNLKLQIRQLQKAQQEAPAIAAQLAKFDLLLPQTADLPTFIRQLQEAADESGIDLASIAPSPPAALAAGPGVDPALAGKGVFQINVTLTVSGGFFRLKSFLQRLEGLQRVVVVNNLALTPSSTSEEDQGLLAATISLTMFMVNPNATTATSRPSASPTPTASGGQSGPATPAPSAS